MPCSGAHMDANHLEKEMSKVASHLDELEGIEINESWYSGYHPDVYCKSFNVLNTEHRDNLVSELCLKLQNIDVSKYSLEMQIWWRDHKNADKERLEREIEEVKKEEDKQKALSKLTTYEKGLLGIND